MTVRHLLNQTSGLPQLAGLQPLTDFDNSSDATEHQARALSTLVLPRPVGSAWEYCNMNYNLLGLVIEAASGESYEAYVQTHIFAPLEMFHSFTSQAEAKRNGMAVGHRFWFATRFAPGGELICSSGDMARYLITHLNEGRYHGAQILSPAGIDELHRPAVEAKAMSLSFGHYGMGWIIERTGKTKIVWHLSRLLCLRGDPAGAKERRSIARKRQPFDDGQDDLYRGWGRRCQAARRRTIRPEPVWRCSLGTAGQPLIPALQLVGVAATLRRLLRWHQDPSSHPLGGTKCGRYILLPLIPDLLDSLPLVGLLGSGTLEVLLLFIPDVSWTALLCGSFALAWMAMRTGLVLWTLRKRSVP